VTLRVVIQRLRNMMSRGHGEDGQGMTEYAVILVLVSIIAIVLVTIIGHQTSNSFSDISGAFPAN